jgi:hypothetical protein
LFVRKWINSVETNDIKDKTDFQSGMHRLVDKGDDDNGVWKMMVAASALHEQQTHNLDILQQENTNLKSRIDGHYTKAGARVQENSLGKRKTEIELDHFDVAVDASSNLWSEFASDMSSF